LVTVREFLLAVTVSGDLLVKVLELRLSDETLLVDDGSTPEPFRVQLTGTCTAVGWIFAKVVQATG